MKESIFNIPNEFISQSYDDKQKLPDYRTVFMRDRDRVMYATAFRRLAGKTQIYTIGADDHKKNRLTHSIEVSQIARTITVALNLNEALAEAIALSHDFGHTPFGHAGEEMLHAIMSQNSCYIKNSPLYRKNLKEIEDQLERESSSKIKDQVKIESMFGFKHNIQSVRVVSMLEDSYRDDSGTNVGLNLTNYTMWGILNHSSLSYKGKDYQPNFQNLFSKLLCIKGHNTDAWSLEGYIVKMADDIAQWHHDLEDAIRGNAVPICQICSTVKKAIGKALSEEDSNCLDDLSSNPAMTRKALAQLSHIVINTLVNDLVETSKHNISVIEKSINNKMTKANTDDKAQTLFLNYDEMYEQGVFDLSRDSIISFSNKINSKLLKESIIQSVHHSRNVERMNEKGKYLIRKLFEAYYSHPQQLPDGPIIHFMVESKLISSIDKAREEGIGSVRLEFEKACINMKLPYKIILMRRICDHIASMTDRYAIEEYNNLYG